MDNAFTLGKRSFSAAIAAATILWSVGLAAFAVPTTAHAASAGDVIKGESLSTLYYYGYDGARYTFPNEKTYDTWFNGFSDVETISDSALADISLAGNVVYRPGARWIKITSDPKTYAVSTDGMIHWIETEDVATDYAGSDWNTNIDDVADTFFVDYSAGTSLMSADAFDGMMYMDGGNYYLAWGGEMRMVSSAGRSANDMESRFFLDGSGIDDSSLSAGDDVTGAECELMDAAQTGDCEDEVVAGGDVTISVSSSTPAGTTVPEQANSVPVFSFDAKAGSEDANLNVVTLTMSAVGATSTISNVYLYEGSTRLTEARSVNSSTRTVTFGSLDLDIEAGDTRTLTVRVDLANISASDEVQFSIDSADDVTVDGGDAVGSFPVSGEVFDISSSAAVGSVTITKNGTITNPSLGEDDAVVGRFKATTSGEDATIEELTLKIDNSADHDDFRLWVDGDQVATGEYMGDKLVEFTFSEDVMITDGNSEIFEVSADISGEASDAVKVYIDNNADIVATGGDYGFGMSVTRTAYDGDSCTSTSGDCSYSTIQGGDVTFSLNGPTTGDILVNSQDQVLLEFNLTSAQEITVKDLDIIVYADDDGDNDALDAADDDAGNADGDADGLVNTSTEANITDIKIVNAATGTVLMGPLELDALTDAAAADDADQTIDFTDDFGMEAGETLTLQVTADIDDSVTSGTEFGAAIDISGFVAEDSNGDNLTNSTDVVPTSDITGYNQEANAASLTVSLASTPGDVTAVQGVDGEEVQAFNFVAGDAGEVNISDITLSVYAHDASTGTFQLGDCTSGNQCATRDVDVNDFIESCSLYAGSDMIDGPKAPASGGATITFDDVDWTMEATENARVSVQCNLANPSQTNDVYFAFDLDDVSEDITAEDAEGTDVDPTSDDPNGATSPTNVLTVTASGSITATVDATTPAADFVMAGSMMNEMAVFRLTATNEDFIVDKLVVTEENGEDQTGTANSTVYTNNIELVTLEYTNSAGETETAEASMSGNEATFTGLDILVGASSHTLVTAYVDVPDTDRVGGGSATSNERIELGLSADAGDFNAVGVDSGTTDTALSAVETNRPFVVKETAPTVSVSASTPSGTGFVPGDQEVFRFNVSANDTEDVIIKELYFTFTATDNDGTEGTTDNQPDWNECDSDVTSGYGIYPSMLDLYNLSEEGLASALDVNADWTIIVGSGTACTTSQADVIGFALDLTTVETIPAGETHTFVLYFDSSRANAANDDSLQVSLPADPALESSSFASVSYLNEDNLAATATTITVASGAGYDEGDILCMDTADDGCDASDEKMLVTAKSGNDLTVIRGYLNTTPDTSSANDTNDDVDKVQSSFFWEDDGDSSTSNTGDEWGAYLIDTLPALGKSIGF